MRNSPSASPIRTIQISEKSFKSTLTRTHRTQKHQAARNKAKKRMLLTTRIHAKAAGAAELHNSRLGKSPAHTVPPNTKKTTPQAAKNGSPEQQQTSDSDNRISPVRASSHMQNNTPKSRCCAGAGGCRSQWRFSWKPATVPTVKGMTTIRMQIMLQQFLRHVRHLSLHLSFLSKVSCSLCCLVSSLSLSSVSWRVRLSAMLARSSSFRASRTGSTPVMCFAERSAFARFCSVTASLSRASTSKASRAFAVKLQRCNEDRISESSSFLDSKTLGKGGFSLCSSIVCCKSCNVPLNSPQDRWASSYACSCAFKSCVAFSLDFCSIRKFSLASSACRDNIWADSCAPLKNGWCDSGVSLRPDEFFKSVFSPDAALLTDATAASHCLARSSSAMALSIRSWRTSKKLSSRRDSDSFWVWACSRASSACFDSSLILPSSFIDCLYWRASPAAS